MSSDKFQIGEGKTIAVQLSAYEWLLMQHALRDAKAKGNPTTPENLVKGLVQLTFGDMYNKDIAAHAQNLSDQLQQKINEYQNPL
jgi:hypothetical protein